jgi:hypothetical protein
MHKKKLICFYEKGMIRNMIWNANSYLRYVNVEFFCKAISNANAPRSLMLLVFRLMKKCVINNYY